MGDLEGALEMGMAMPDDPAESFLSPKTANTPSSTGFLALNMFQDRKGINDLFSVFEPRPVVPFSNRPPKAVEDIYKSLPSVAGFFPDWPFHPLELPQLVRKKLKWKDAEKLKKQQDWNRELSLTRIHAPGTAAHRLLNHTFKQDIKDFSAEYEAFRRNGFQAPPDEQQKANERPTPYIFGVSRYNPQLHNPELYTSNQGLAVKSADEVADLHNKAFKCSLCKFSPHYDDIPNWLYYTKVDEDNPRYFYCLGCKGRDGDAQMKSFTNLMTMVKEIVAICQAEEDAKKMGMDGVITSVPLARFKRYEIMFNIEVEAAMVRRAIKAAKTQLMKNAEKFRQRQLEKISGDFGFSIVGKAVAKEIVDRYFTTEIPRLFDTTGPLGQPERFGSTTPPGFPIGMESGDQQARILAVSDEEVRFPAERSHTPPRWPKDYIPPVMADNIHQGNDPQASPGRPPTPVWFAETQTMPTTSSPPACSTTPPGDPQWVAPLERAYEESVLYAGTTKFTDTSTPHTTTPSGYPEWFTPRPSALYEEFLSTDATTLTNVSTARSSITQPEVHIPFQNFSAFVHPEGALPGDYSPPGYPEGVITWLTRPDTPPGSPEDNQARLEDNEPPSSARSSRTLYGDYIPQFDGACDTPGSSTRSSITLPEDFGPQLADTITVVERSSPKLFEIFRYKPLIDEKQENKEGSLPDPGRPLRRSPTVGNSLYLLSQGGIPARLPPKTERIPPARSEQASYYKYKDGESFPYKAEATSFYRPCTSAQPAAQSERGSFSSNSNTIAEAQPPPKLDRATFYKYNPDATIPQKLERRSFYKCKSHNKEFAGHGSPHGSLSSIAEEKLEDHPESDFSDISADWDSDESFDEPPRRLRCLDLLDELIPPRQNEYAGSNSRMWNSKPIGKRGRNVDLSLNSILEDSEPEDSEPEDSEPEDSEPEDSEPEDSEPEGELVQCGEGEGEGKGKRKKIDRGKA